MANPSPFDEFDHRLLHLLQRDSAATLTVLGDAVGLSASAVQRRISRYRQQGLLREVAVVDPMRLGTTLAMVLVQLERDAPRGHTALNARVRAAPEVQQCYVLAGDWDYLVMLATAGVAHCREVAYRLFSEEGVIRRYETRMVFDVVKLGLALPTRVPARRRK